MAGKKLSLAWIGSLTAVFSLIAGIYGGWTFFSGQLEKRRTMDRLMAAQAVQLQAADYNAAWKTLTQAATLDPSSERVQQAQEDVAMRWLDHIRASEGQSFSSITDELAPVLTRGAALAKSPQRQGDILAHLGWSYFLRERESASAPDPESAYRNALSKDPANPYAHAMWGHWILWNHRDLAKASEQFADALAAPRPALRSYIRSMQLSALNNDGTSEAYDEMIRVANDVRKEHGDLGAPWPHDILNVYQEQMVPPKKDTPAFLSAVPALDHLETFDWLLLQAGPDDSDSLSHAYVRSILLEAAGRRDDALAAYRRLQSALSPENNQTLADLTSKAIIRLRGAK